MFDSMTSPAKKIFESVEPQNLIENNSSRRVLVIENNNSPLIQLKKLLDNLDMKLELPERFSKFLGKNIQNFSDLKFLEQLQSWVDTIKSFPFFDKTVRGKLLLKRLHSLITKSINFVNNKSIEIDCMKSRCLYKYKKELIDYLPEGFKNGNKMELKFYLKVIETRLDIEARLSKPKKEYVGKLYRSFYERIIGEGKELNEDQIKIHVNTYFNN